jgi:hypothetical protein
MNHEYQLLRLTVHLIADGISLTANTITVERQQLTHIQLFGILSIITVIILRYLGFRRNMVASEP